MAEWDDLKEATLKRLWEDEPRLSKNEIGIRMGISGNAVIGKAHRMGLPPRPSPIKPRPPENPVAPKVPRFREVATAPPLPSEGANLRAELTALVGVAEGLQARDGASAELTGPPRPLPHHRACQWPLGDPRNRAAFGFCGEETTPGRPYCAGHCKEAYGRQPRD